MHLKKLIISGFKSFADRVVLNFDEGITGIVGPNGSGKSNVIDAVRWIMGEQNAKNLRGKVATDIIFSGSQKRQAMTMAEVNLFFDNSDFSPLCPPEYRYESEISLTRRLYVDGEREYLINKKPCRFKDIVSFFATTGLGGRSYSMIQQGQVDRILNAKPEDVREILEEAAGTSLFKERAAAAQKKLQGTQENLARIDDILNELSGRLEVLKDQVEKAKEWRHLSDEIRNRELKLFVFNYEAFNGRLKNLYNQLEGEVDKEVEHIGHILAFESKLEELRSQLQGSDPELETLREQIGELQKQQMRAEGIILAAHAMIDNGHKRLEEIENEVKNEGTELNSAENAVDDALNKMLSAQDELARLNCLSEAFEDQVDDARQAYEVYKNRIDDLEEEIRNIDRMLENNAARCESFERDRKRVAEEIDGQKKRVELLEQELTVVEEGINETQELVSAQKTGLDKQVGEKQLRQQALIRRNEEFSRLNEQRETLKLEYITAKVRHSSIAELSLSATDVSNDIKRLKNECVEDADIIKGLLTDYFTFQKSLSELPESVVSAFEIWAEKVIVDDFSALNALVNLAQKCKLGSLPVLVLESMKEKEGAERASWANQCGAVPLLQYLNIVEDHPIILQLLRRLYYLPFLELSYDDVAGIPDGTIVFTPQGVVVTGTDEFFIGNKVVKGVLSRKSEMEKLEGKILELEVNLNQIQIHLEELDADQQDDNKLIKEVEELLSHQNKETFNLSMELQGLLQQKLHKQQLLEDSAAQYSKSEDYLFNLTKSLEQLGESRIGLGEDRGGLLEDLKGLQEEAVSVEERNTELRVQHERKNIDKARLETRAGAEQTAYIAAKARFERAQGALLRRSEDKTRVEAEIEQARGSEVRALLEIEHYLSKKEELDELLSLKREQNSGLFEEIRVIERRLDELKKKQAEFERLKSSKNIELERLKTQVENLIEQAFEKYQIDLNTFSLAIESDFEKDRVTGEIYRLKQKIDKIGAVNMCAIEEYDKSLARHDFILAQKEEVIGSMNLLEEAIFEIQETAKIKFLQTFSVINDNYQSLFPILFPGGEAHLQLTDQDDPLNAGVDIFARLPGKATQHMTLFSGGEKALTAISLIFALLKTKPTPFCFLDEVDAPLDEANVGRYNRILEELSSRFQFIVITHNRRTMEVLDQLYGVTMQEGGVSKVVGVDMQKDLPDHLKKAFKEEKKPDVRAIEGATIQSL